MTVAAVILAPPPVVALPSVGGRSVVHAVVDAAYAGGATPIVVVTPAVDALRADLADTDALVVAPAGEPGIAWWLVGCRAAAEAVAGTTAALLWPGRHTWVDPETVTTLIEAHGVRPDAVLRPAFEGEPGFPALIPTVNAEALAGMPGLHGPEAIERLAGAGIPVEHLELGDPGAVHDASTPRDALPPYRGPIGPGSGRSFEWGSAAAADLDAAH